MSSRAEYLKKYLSNDDDAEKKKKKKKTKTVGFKPLGMKLIEEDAFLSVEAAKQREYGSDEEREEIEVIKQSVKKAKVIPGFKKTFAESEIKQEIKEEVISPPQSPCRTIRHNRNNSENNSPPRRQRQRHDSDNSPPRSSRKRHDSDASPPRRKRHDSDNSPPRSRKRHDSDNSPPRRKNVDSDSSPPRKTRRRNDSDNSPPRKTEKSRRTRHDSDNSPPRRDNRDLSPKRRRRNDSDDDLSPPRRQKSPDIRKVKKEVDSDEENTKLGKMSDGKKSGLQSAKELKKESEKIKARDAQMFKNMDSAVSGRDAETVYRTKQTKRGKKETDEQKEKREREQKMTEMLKEKYKDMNKGLEQMKKRQEQLEEMARVASEPMARARDDKAMNAHLKEVLHEADPMANLIRKKRRETAIDRGELVYPTYQGSFVPNRFNIPPGYRWDGVDRSNGFEGKLAKNANQNMANHSEYIKSIAEYE